jgi:hypothetical protein
MEINVKETKVMRISRQSSPVQIMIEQKQLQNVEYLKYFSSMIANDARCTCEIKYRISTGGGGGRGAGGGRGGGRRGGRRGGGRGGGEEGVGGGGEEEKKKEKEEEEKKTLFTSKLDLRTSKKLLEHSFV